MTRSVLFKLLFIASLLISLVIPLVVVKMISTPLVVERTIYTTIENPITWQLNDFVLDVEAPPASGLPPGMNLIKSPVGVTWTPTTWQPGTYHIDLSAKRGYEHAQIKLTVQVDLSPRPPLLEESLPNTAQEDVPYHGRLAFQNSTGKKLDFRIVEAPRGMFIGAVSNDEFEIKWQPTAEQTGSHPLVIDVCSSVVLLLCSAVRSSCCC